MGIFRFSFALCCVVGMMVSPGVVDKAFAASPSQEELTSGQIVEVDSEQSEVTIQTEGGAQLQLYVDPYSTVIWKERDYVENLERLVNGDQVEVGYFIEQKHNLAGWIDVIEPADATVSE